MFELKPLALTGVPIQGNHCNFQTIQDVIDTLIRVFVLSILFFLCPFFLSLFEIVLNQTRGDIALFPLLAIYFCDNIMAVSPLIDSRHMIYSTSNVVR